MGREGSFQALEFQPLPSLQVLPELWGTKMSPGPQWYSVAWPQNLSLRDSAEVGIQEAPRGGLSSLQVGEQQSEGLDLGAMGATWGRGGFGACLGFGAGLSGHPSHVAHQPCWEQNKATCSFFFSFLIVFFAFSAESHPCILRCEQHPPPRPPNPTFHQVCCVSG